MKVRDVMMSPVVEIRESDTVQKAGEVMAARGTGAPW